MAKGARKALGEKIDAIEGAYEFFLAYAAQGMSHEVEGSRINEQLRRHVDAMSDAVFGLDAALGDLAAEEDLPSPERFQAFREVVEVDAARAGAAVALVQGKSFVSSQLVDNLNASVHLRALLTDLFLLDEFLDLGVDQATQPQSSESPS